MAMIVWSELYSVKVASIDQQHQKLFAILNELHDAMKVGAGARLVPDILHRLIDYTREHFAYEEKLQQQAHFSGYANHKMEHDKLTAQVVQMAADLQAGKGVLTVHLLEFLRNWLQAHILDCDKKYSETMQAAGIR